MKRLLVVGTVMLLACFMAAPAMAVPITFNFWGEITADLNGAGDATSTFTMSLSTDTDYMKTGFIDPPDMTINVPYYATPFGATGTLTFGSDSFGIADPLYVAYDKDSNGGSFGFGIWDPFIFNDPDIPAFSGDILSIFNVGSSYDMMSPIGETSTSDFLIPATNSFLNLDGGGSFDIAETGATWVKYSVTGGVASVPEPSMLLLFGSGLTGLFLLRRKA